MQVKVLFFGPAKDITHLSSQFYTVETGSTLQSLINRLYQDFPQAKEVFELCSFVINTEFASPEAILREEDEVAVLPPVSGG